jgi:hypothetical protein
MSHDSNARVAEMAVDRGPESAYEAYNEDAFRHFLWVERSRAERSGRSLMLLLVEFRAEHAATTAIDRAAAVELFTALAPCVREIDFMGWYRSGLVAGVVLTQGADGPEPDGSRQIGERVADVLAERLPVQVRPMIQVRVLQMRSRQKN